MQFKKKVNNAGRPASSQMSFGKPASPLQSAVHNNNTPITSVGSVARVAAGSSIEQVGGFSVTLDNSAGVVEELYIIGDPEGLIAAIIGAGKIPDGGSIPPAAMQRSFGIAPMSVL